MKPPVPQVLSAQQRLAASRQALLDAAVQPGGAQTLLGAALQQTWAQWWQRQPVLAAAASLAQPALQEQARRHPWRLLAAAAATGACIAAVRPWRWQAPRRWARARLMRGL